MSQLSVCVAVAVGWTTDSACYYLFALATMGVTIVRWERDEDYGADEEGKERMNIFGFYMLHLHNIN